MTGRLTKKPELRYTASNVPVCEFTIATNRPTIRDGERKADFITCVAWRKLAENLCNYQDKGNMVGVIGNMRTDSFDKADGSRGYKTYVLANEIEFLESKKTTVDEVPAENPAENSTESADPYTEFGENITLDFTDDSDMELPF